MFFAKVRLTVLLFNSSSVAISPTFLSGSSIEKQRNIRKAFFTEERYCFSRILSPLFVLEEML